MIWSYNAQGEWTNRHQMTINGKRNGFEKQDLIDVARQFRISKPLEILANVGTAVRGWPDFAEEVGVETNRITQIASTHRLEIVV